VSKDFQCDSGARQGSNGTSWSELLCRTCASGISIAKPRHPSCRRAGASRRYRTQGTGARLYDAVVLKGLGRDAGAIGMVYMMSMVDSVQLAGLAALIRRDRRGHGPSPLSCRRAIVVRRRAVAFTIAEER